MPHTVSRLRPETLYKARRKSVSAVWIILRTVVLVGLSFVLLYPLLYIVSMAFRPYQEVMNPLVVWVPEVFTLDNMELAVQAMNYVTSLGQTLLISIVSSAISLGVYSLTGYGFARFRFRLRGVLFFILILSIILPPQAMLIPLYLQNSVFDFFSVGRLGGLFTGRPLVVNILDSVWCFYLPALFGYGIRSGILIFIFVQFFRGMPKELEDAAYIDGCGPFHTFLRIMLPNASAAFITVFLFSFVWYWNDYTYSGLYLINNQTLPLKLSQIESALSTATNTTLDPNLVQVLVPAGCLLIILPPLAVYVVFQRYFTESIERTGIVG